MFDSLRGKVLLAVEAATDVCSVAVATDGRIVSRHAHAPRRHAELVLQYCHEALEEAEVKLTHLDALVVGRGPGSFTGVRIAVAVAQGLAMGANVPVAPVSTLASLAQSVFRQREETAVCAALDARMDEIYCGAFRADAAGLMRPVGEERVLAMADLELPQGRWFGAGPGWQRYADEVPAALAQQIHGTQPEAEPCAADALVLGAALVDDGQLMPVSALEPVYLRNRVTR